MRQCHCLLAPTCQPRIADQHDAGLATRLTGTCASNFLLLASEARMANHLRCTFYTLQSCESIIICADSDRVENTTGKSSLNTLHAAVCPQDDAHLSLRSHVRQSVLQQRCVRASKGRTLSCSEARTFSSAPSSYLYKLFAFADVSLWPSQAFFPAGINRAGGI
jgi:hypothetical protein